MTRIVLILALIFVPTANADETRTLFKLVDQRLELMRTVAAWKWQHHVPIEDLEREEIVLEQAAETALTYGLEPESTQRFFAEQILAAKEIQSHWFDAFITERSGGQAQDLETTRAELIRLGDAITAALGAAAPIAETWKPLFMEAIRVEGLSTETEVALFEALIGIKPFASKLDQVLATGILRVGTTGDYAPFSDSDDGVSFTGIDIDLAEDLAKGLGVDVIFIQTSWPTLITDLQTGKFDIAMSGVSRTLARARVGYFSEPYHVGGKTPIVRCRDKRRYSNLEKINAPDVRVIVNPGGTNDRFARTNIDRAELIVFDDNRKIFDEIAAGRADVMITDAIEVRLVTAKKAGLCASMPGETLTYQEKGFLMPRDMPLQSFVNLWLETRLADGFVDAAFERHLSP